MRYAQIHKPRFLTAVDYLDRSPENGLRWFRELIAIPSLPQCVGSHSTNLCRLDGAE